MKEKILEMLAAETAKVAREKRLFLEMSIEGAYAEECVTAEYARLATEEATLIRVTELVKGI